MIDAHVDQIKSQFEIVDTIDLGPYFEQAFHHRLAWVHQNFLPLYREVFENNERIIFVLKDYEQNTSRPGEISDMLYLLHEQLNKINISNFFYNTDIGLCEPRAISKAVVSTN